MKIVAAIASILLGLLFIMAASTVLFGFPPPPADAQMPAAGTPGDHFMQAFFPTGYMHVVKVCELIGGLLLLVPLTRNIGLLFLGPVIVNIVVYHATVMKGQGLADPMLVGICVLAAFLLFVERKAWLGLIKR